MFGRKEQPKKSLNEILEVFTTTQDKLTKSKSVLAKLSEILK